MPVVLFQGGRFSKKRLFNVLVVTLRYGHAVEIFTMYPFSSVHFLQLAKEDALQFEEAKEITIQFHKLFQNTKLLQVIEDYQPLSATTTYRRTEYHGSHHSFRGVPTYGFPSRNFLLLFASPVRSIPGGPRGVLEVLVSL